MLAPIKLLLLIPLILLVIYFLIRSKDKLSFRIMLLFITLAGIGFVIFPDFTTTIANYLHVGRGADLVTYVFMVVVFLFIVYLYSKIRGIMITQTKIIREMSLKNAETENSSSR